MKKPNRRWLTSFKRVANAYVSLCISGKSFNTRSRVDCWRLPSAKRAQSTVAALHAPYKARVGLYWAMVYQPSI